MRKWLYILLVIEIAASAIGFFILLLNTFWLAFIYIPLSLLGLVPIIAIIHNYDKIEDLSYELNRLKYELKNLTDSKAEEISNETLSVPAVSRKETARGAWECIKCGTVNKEGTTHCMNCKADYSPWDNPTDSPYEKKKLSRWVK